jgi:hypothetical protein
MANDRTREDLDRNEADLIDEDMLDERDQTTGEVGSEGGSPGDRVKTVRPAEVTRGSEATETARPKR